MVLKSGALPAALLARCGRGRREQAMSPSRVVPVHQATCKRWNV